MMTKWAFFCCVLVFPVVSSSADETVEISVSRDIVYNETHKLLCDVYQPVNLSEACPVVIVVHGGAWMSGDKSFPAAYARLLAQRGIAAVSINYRLAPQHKFPAQVDDMRNAIDWVKRSAPEKNWDLEQLGLFGYSAGAHLVSLVSALYDEDEETRGHTYRKKIGVSSPNMNQLPKPIAVAAGGTPTDFRVLPPDNTMLSYFLDGSRREQPQNYISASPAAVASSADVPTLFFHGTKDALVPIGSAERLYNKHIELKIDSELVRIDGTGHLLAFLDDRSKQAVLEFFLERFDMTEEQ